MTFELPFELFARVLLALLSDVGNTTIARAFPWADEQLCRCGFKALGATSQTCIRNKRAVLVADLWGKAAGMVLWPPSHVDTAASRSLAQRLQASGSCCRYLIINCMALEYGELTWLSRCCCSVEMLQLRFFGPESFSSNMEWLDAWSHSLRRLSIQFWYDDCLGAPPIQEVTQYICRSCRSLEALWLKGIDWPKARIQIAAAIKNELLGAGKCLRRLSLEGSQPWPDDEINVMRAAGLVVEVCLLSDRTR
ncbi:unnamed protein product [Durusdinium trenchii]|uniref:Uncharacterized protein n=1 Tax=Durusdinium trenchii TaxID=1381693 RepID=A0ABP0KFN0_9DINO